MSYRDNRTLSKVGVKFNLDFVSLSRASLESPLYISLLRTKPTIQKILYGKTEKNRHFPQVPFLSSLKKIIISPLTHLNR